MQTRPQLQDLPNELIQHSLSSLTIRELVRLQRTSRTMREHAMATILLKINENRAPARRFASYEEAIAAIQNMRAEIEIEGTAISLNVFLKNNILEGRMTF